MDLAELELATNLLIRFGGILRQAQLVAHRSYKDTASIHHSDIVLAIRWDYLAKKCPFVRKNAHLVTALTVSSFLLVISLHSEDSFVYNVHRATLVFRAGSRTWINREIIAKILFPFDADKPDTGLCLWLHNGCFL